MPCLFFDSKYSTLFRRTKAKKRKFIPKAGMVYNWALLAFYKQGRGFERGMTLRKIQQVARAGLEPMIAGL